MVSLDRLLNIGLMGIIFIGSVFWSWTFFSPMYLPPVKYNSLTILNSPISDEDDGIIGQVVFDRRRNCSGEVRRAIVRLVGSNGNEEIVYRDIVPTAPTKIGEGVVVSFKMMLPRPRQAGSYIYRGIVRFDCDGKVFTLETPAAPFQVR